MKQLNNSSTPKGRKVSKRRILFFLFLILAVIASILFLYLKRTVDQERKQDKIEKEITTEREKDGVGNLHKKYKDMIGWLEIKGTGFSYPVMQTGIKGGTMHAAMSCVNAGKPLFVIKYADDKTDSDEKTLGNHMLVHKHGATYIKGSDNLDDIARAILRRAGKSEPLQPSLF